MNHAHAIAPVTGHGVAFRPKPARKPGSIRNFYAVALTDVVPTGYPSLDRLLPGGGWPSHGVTEIVAAPGYVDPVTILLPALANLSAERRWLTWIAPPHLPATEDLADRDVMLDRILMVHESLSKVADADGSTSNAHRTGNGLSAIKILEQALANRQSSAILAWIDEVDGYQMKRLTAAARENQTTVFLFRPPRAEWQNSKADLKVFVSTHSRNVDVEILQSRCQPGKTLRLMSPPETEPDQPIFTPAYYRRSA